MNREYTQVLRLKQLSELLASSQPALELQSLSGGWLKALRQALGLSLKSVAARLKLSPQAIHQIEKSESAQTISLKQLEAVAGAMGCRVVYALVPRQGTLAELANSGRNEALRSVQHSMSLEGQAIEHPEELP
jgi:predicted DNA-binding mobile mystery protein A